MTEREALKMALEALENVYGKGKRCEAAIAAIREALAQPEREFVCSTGLCHYKAQPEPEQDPVGEVDSTGMAVIWSNKPLNGSKLYTAPPKRTWVGLTADELNMIGNSMRTWNSHSLTDIYIAIEDKLRSKNT